ncbi:MAG: helix-turn-helix domain-containing protein [Candidatus Moranbacteria bacterium]|nr:helix-turn-helix domain-containing protein [Candidatus Moranbacteria bacterium]
MKISKKELQFIINQGEGYNVEFKENYSSGITKEICAMANATGGKILIGVSDEGETKPVKITNKLKSEIQDLARNLDPSLSIYVLESEKILAIDVPEGSAKPYSTGGKFYLRQGSNSQQLSRSEIRVFFQKEGLVLFDEKPNNKFDLSKDLSKESFDNFLRLSGIKKILPAKAILENLNLISARGEIKNAGVLLFSKNIGKFFLQATITCVLFQGKTKYKILDRKEFEGDLFSNYENAFNYLRAKLNTEFIIKGGPREEKLELPEEALREAILNAIAHRDYFVTGANIQVYIFSDRVEITNPGGLANGITIKELGKRSLSRNNLLFGLMQRMDLVEKIGSGILRMKKAMKDYGLHRPNMEIDENWFSIIFKRSTQNMREKSSEKSSDKSSEKILRLLREDGTLSASFIAKEIGISPRAVEKNLAKLKNEGIIKRVGPNKGGHWEIIQDIK